MKSEVFVLARVSRKMKNNLSKLCNNNEKQLYNTGLYIRISSADLSDEENTIENQKNLLFHFINQMDELILKNIYCDNGETGSDFERPEWNRLMNDILKKEINCIVVKDLSRFGRNYLETAIYLENVFPKLNLRFIAVNDNYDTNINTALDFAVRFKNIANDFYVKDISKKIFSAKLSQRKAGKFTGGFPPYGYLKDNQNKYHLVIDPETAPIVKKIFSMKLQRKTNIEIAKILNRNKIVCPYRYLYEKGKAKNEQYKNAVWKYSTIHVLIKNQIYTGDMVQGKYQQCLAEGKSKPQKIKEEDYIIISNTHEPIISKDIFWKVQTIYAEEIKKNKAKREQNIIEHKEDIFKGYLFNQYGKKLYRKYTKKSQETIYYYYETKEILDKNEVFYSKSHISELQLKKILIIMINTLIKLYFFSNKFYYNEQIQNQLKIIKNELEQYSKKLEVIYKNWKDGILNKEKYLLHKEKAFQQYKKYQIQYNQLLKKEKVNFSNDTTLMENINKIKSENEILKQFIKIFIEKIIVYKNNQVEIKFL